VAEEKDSMQVSTLMLAVQYRISAGHICCSCLFHLKNSSSSVVFYYWSIVYFLCI